MKALTKIVLAAVVCSSAVTAYPQQVLSLEQCREMAIKRSKELEIKREEIHAAESKKKEAFSAYLPKVGLTAGYIHVSDEMSLLSQDKFLPIGALLPNGSFGFSTDAVAFQTTGKLSPELNNQWVINPQNNKPVPVDAAGIPFDPQTNPEKLEWKNYTTIPKEELTIDMRNILLGSLGVVQPIYMGGKIRQLNKMAQLGIDISKQQAQQQASEILYNVENSYWTVISVSQKVKVARDYSKLLTRLTSDVEHLAAEGLATKSDILKVRVKYNEVNMSLTKAINGLQLAKMSLCQQLGLPLDTDIVLADTEAPEKTDSVIPQADVQKAIENRTELQSLGSLIKISEARVGLARSGYLPTIGLTANYMASNINFFNGFEKEFSTSWNVGLMMRVPIINWGENTGKLRHAKSEKRIAELKKQETEEKIELQVSQANFKMMEALTKLSLTQRDLEEANENLRYAKLAFEEGVAGLSSMLEAQAAWYSASSSYTDAKIEVQMCNTYLKKVTGELTN